MSDVFVKGLSQLQAALDTLPVQIEKNIMRGALRAGAKLLAEEAKAQASGSVHTGRLRDNIRFGVMVKRGTVQAYIRAGKRRNNDYASGFYARWVEFGTKPHRIVAGPGKLLPIGGGVKSAQHPGSAPHPFMRPALDTRSLDAVQAVADYIRARLQTQHGINVPGPGNIDDASE